MKQTFTIVAIITSLSANAQYDYEKPKIEDILVMLLGYFVAFIIGVCITRWIFSVPRFIKYQKMQTIIALRQAERNGMPKEEIDEILNIIQEKEGARFTHETEFRVILSNLNGEKEDLQSKLDAIKKED